MQVRAADWSRKKEMSHVPQEGASWPSASITLELPLGIAKKSILFEQS